MYAFLIIAGVVVFAYACRTFAHPFIRRLSNIAVLAATFLVGYFLSGGSIVWGVVAACSWFMLPWIEILMRIRHMRLPLDKQLRHKHPPSRDIFPLLGEYTSEIEEEGFEHVEDAGWDWEETKQFIRVFYNEKERMQAAIYLNQQNHIAFAYLSLSTRTKDGKNLTTWNYPFSYTMKFSPDLQVNRVLYAHSFLELMDCHNLYLIKSKVTKEELKEQDTEKIQEEMERDLRNQINHNLDKGLIRLSGEGTFRYSWRGMFYLWFQFVKDMVKMS